MVGGGKGEGFRVQGTVGSDIWYEPGEAGREAVMTEAEWVDGDYGSPGELRKINKPSVGKRSRYLSMVAWLWSYPGEVFLRFLSMVIL